MSAICRRCNMAKSFEDLRNPQFYKALIAEYIGTLFLVLIGCGTCIGDWENFKNPTIVQISLAFGLSVATMAWCIGHVSGCHINPAVTMAMLVTRKISIARALLYIAFQCLGACTGSALLKGITPTIQHSNLGLTVVTVGVKPEQAFGVEFLITFVLVLTVFASCDGQRNDLKGSAPLAIGISVSICHLFAIPYTGSSMNSARTFGPAAVGNNWDNHWVYWLGPIMGGVTAGVLYEYVFAVNSSRGKVKGCLLSVNYESVATHDTTGDYSEKAPKNSIPTARKQSLEKTETV